MNLKKGSRFLTRCPFLWLDVFTAELFEIFFIECHHSASAVMRQNW